MKSNNIIKKLWPFFLSIIIVSAAIFLYFNPPAAINIAGLQVEYKGSDQHASVFLNNQFIEKAPLVERDLQSGDYILKIVPDDQDLAEFTTPITLAKGTLTVVSYHPGPTARESSASIYELEAVSDLNEFGVVIFETYPEHALLSFDQNATQYTPITLENLSPKEYSYSVSLPSYKIQENTLQVLAGYKIKATIKLAKISENNLATELLETDPSIDLEATEAAQLDENKDESWGVADAELIASNKVKILNTNFFVNSEEVLRVRVEANKNAKELGFAKSNFYYPYIEDSQEEDLEAVAATTSAQLDDWLKISFEGQEGWVSSDFAELIIDEELD